MFIILSLICSVFALNAETASNFQDTFKVARECRHWDGLLKRKYSTDQEFITSVKKRTASLKCDSQTDFIKKHEAILSYVERKEICQHFGGEESYDKARADEIAKAMKTNKCDDLDAEEKVLSKTNEYKIVINNFDNLPLLPAIP